MLACTQQTLQLEVNCTHFFWQQMVITDSKHMSGTRIKMISKVIWSHMGPYFDKICHPGLYQAWRPIRFFFLWYPSHTHHISQEKIYGHFICWNACACTSWMKSYSEECALQLHQKNPPRSFCSRLRWLHDHSLWRNSHHLYLVQIGCEPTVQQR
jgi:hypothetical protein